MRITGSVHAWIVCLAYLYFIVPICLFLAGWTNLFIALPTGMFLLYIVFLRWKDSFEKKNFESFFLSKRMIFWSVIIIFVWCLFSGIGGFSFQNSDFNYRNAVFHDLINFSWPVVYCPKDNLAGIQHSPVLLLYYFSYWLPAALVGKIFNASVGEFFLFLWTWFGLCLLYYFILVYLKKISLVPLFILIFFSGADIVGTFLLHGKLPPLGSHIEWWTFMQYSSMTTCLYWVFNQAVPAWLGTILFLLDKRIGARFFIVALVVAFSPFPAIGLLGILCILAVLDYHKGIPFDRKFSRQTGYIIAGFLIFCLYYFFDKQTGRGLHLFLFSGYPLGIFSPQYLLFVFIEFYCIAFCCNRIIADNKKIFIAACVLLYIIPFVQIVSTRDFIMRVSIPSLFILCIFVMKSLMKKSCHISTKFYQCILVVLLVVGSITPLNEIYRSAFFTLFWNKHIIADKIGSLSIPERQTSTFCCTTFQDSFYWQVLAPRSRVSCLKQ